MEHLIPIEGILLTRIGDVVIMDLGVMQDGFDNTEPIRIKVATEALKTLCDMPDNKQPFMNTVKMRVEVLPF